MPEPIIKLRGIEIIYHKGKDNEFRASDGVSFDIYPEEYIIFFGPSGCGKSTLLYCVLGVLPPTGGELLVKGENPYLYSAEEMVRFQTATIGIMYQAFYLIPSLSVADNVALPQIFQGVPPDKRRERAVELLKRFGIDKQADKLPDALSGGQSQRVSVARALVNDPEILLADEPVGNLDSISSEQVMNALADINSKDKKTVILVTHDAKYLPYAHRVIYLKDGKLVRIVPNPEKKQIAKVDKTQTLVTELEQLSKMYPYSTPEELKVKSVVNYLTQDLTFDQLNRMEEAAKLLIEGNADQDKFYNMLADKYEQGGVGLSPARALQLKEKVMTVLTEARDVRRYRRRLLHGDLFTNQNQLISKLTLYLKKIYPGKLKPEQSKRLKEAVYDRLVGNSKKDNFERFLRTSLDKGGAGFNPKDALRLTWHLEKIMIQGLESSGEGH
jgi:putative ABC transport system ATP-binding protein